MEHKTFTSPPCFFIQRFCTFLMLDQPEVHPNLDEWRDALNAEMYFDRSSRLLYVYGCIGHLLETRPKNIPAFCKSIGPRLTEQLLIIRSRYAKIYATLGRQTAADVFPRHADELSVCAILGNVATAELLLTESVAYDWNGAVNYAYLQNHHNIFFFLLSHLNENRKVEFETQPCSVMKEREELNIALIQCPYVQFCFDEFVKRLIQNECVPALEAYFQRQDAVYIDRGLMLAAIDTGNLGIVTILVSNAEDQIEMDAIDCLLTNFVDVGESDVDLFQLALSKPHSVQYTDIVISFMQVGQFEMSLILLKRLKEMSIEDMAKHLLYNYTDPIHEFLQR